MVQFMKIRINNYEYLLTDQRYDWIIRSFGHRNNATGEWETDWDQVIKYFEANERNKTEILSDPIEELR